MSQIFLIWASDANELAVILAIVRTKTKMEWSMANVNCLEFMDLLIMEILNRTLLKVMMFTLGVISAFILVTGKTFRFMENDDLFGLTVDVTKEITSTIKRKEKVHLHGLMVESTMVIG